MTTSKTQPNTYPDSAGDATAHTVARHMARIANWRFRKDLDPETPAALAITNISAMSAQFAVAFMLRELSACGLADFADELARSLYRLWDGDGTMGELLWQWVEGYGLDPEGDDHVALGPNTAGSR